MAIVARSWESWDLSSSLYGRLSGSVFGAAPRFRSCSPVGAVFGLEGGVPADRAGALRASSRLAAELDAVRVLEQPVQDGVGHGGFPERFVPVGDGQLAGDDGGAQLRSVLDDLEQVGGLVRGKRSQHQVID